MFNTVWNDPWSTQIGNHLWQSTLVVLVAWIVAQTLRRYRAETRYWVWMGASLKFLLPFSVFAAMGRWMRPAIVPAMQGSPLTSAVVRMEQPFVPSLQGPGGYAMWLSEPASPAQIQQHGVAVGEVLLAVWLCGVLFLLLRWLRDWWELRVTVRDARPECLPIDVPVRVTSRRIEPGVVGLFRPVLLLPAPVLERLPKDQLRAILAHEGCHVRRRDNLTGAIHMLVETIFWFHPAVWWIERRLVAEREAACDEAVLQIGNEAEVYAESILNVCKFYAESPLICVSGVTGSELKQRILHIMTGGVGARLDGGRKLLLSAVAISVLSVPVASGLLRLTEVHAQSQPAVAADRIAATWQGILHADRDSRFVVKIARASDGSLRSTLYNLTGAPGGAPGFSTVFNGSLLTLDFGFATYEGTLSADGNSVSGRWRQGADSQPQQLILVRATPETEWAIPEPPRPAARMAADANPVFEVSTIKPSAPEERGPRFMFDHRRFSVVHVTLDQLVQFVYSLQGKQVVGGPDWFRTETYDIVAQPGGEGEPSIKQWQTMVKKLMEDRFQFRCHEDEREMGVFALTLAKGAPKFASSQADPDEVPMLGFGPGNMGATNATMAQVAEAMQQGAVDRPVVDQTGLAGRFDLRLRWTPTDVPAATQNADAPPDLFTAMQEQLGLRLVATKAPVKVIVTDHVEKPSAN